MCPPHLVDSQTPGTRPRKLGYVVSCSGAGGRKTSKNRNSGVLERVRKIGKY